VAAPADTRAGPAPARPAALGANYRRLWSASAGSNLADGVFRVALPLLALRVTRSPAAVAGVAFAGRLPWLLFALHAGALADRLDRRRTMTLVNVGRGGLIGTVAVLVWADAVSMPVLYLVALALGIGETLFDTAAQSMMPSVVERDQLSRANGRLYAVELTMNQFVGPPLGGLLAGVAIAWAFMGSGAVYLLAAGLLLLLRGSFRPERTTAPASLRTDIAEGVRYLWSSPLLRTFALMVGAMNLVSSCVDALFPVFAVDPGPLGLSEAGFGLLLALGGVGGVVGSVVADRAVRLVGRRRLLIATAASVAPVPAALALTSSPVAIVLAFVLVGSTGMIWNVITVSLRQAITPDHLLGRMNSAYRLLAWGTMPAGAALGGLAAELIGPRGVFVVLAVISPLLVLPMLRLTDEVLDAAEAAAAQAPRPVPFTSAR
jgi:MFS family permease